MHTFRLEPSADIHLLPGIDVQVNVIGFDDAVSIVNPITSQCTFTFADTGIASIDASHILSAHSAGITFMTVEHTASSFKLVARIWSHGSLDNIFLGNNSGSVHNGTDNFQPTVYGLFDVMDLEDITGHPFVSYENLSPTLIDVNPDNGRVTGRATGNATLRIKDAVSGATIGDLPIVVKEALGTARPIVERVTFRGVGEEKRNILFVAEGFAAGEENRFKQIVRNIDNRMRNSVLHQPFRLLNRDYNTWLAFEPSEESGVTLGPAPVTSIGALQLFHLENVQPATTGHYSLFDLINLVGPPIARHMDPAFDMPTAIAEWNTIPGFVAGNLEAGIFNTWKFDSKMFERTMARNSVHGLMYARRLGDIAANDAPAVNADNRWYLEHTVPSTFFYKDPRRTSTSHFFRDDFAHYATNPILSEHWSDEFFTYLNSLKRKNVPATDPLFDIGQRWNQGGADQALVVVIVNDEKHGANFKLMPNLFAAVSAGRNGGILNTSMTIGAIQDHTPNTSRYFLTSLVSHVLHELGHGVFLGDEYDDIREGGNNAPAAGDVGMIEIYHNISTQNIINIRGLKWTRMFRVAKASALLTPGRINAATMTIDVDLYPGEARHWVVGEEMIIATKNLNIEADFNFYSAYNRHPTFAAGPLRITAIAGDTLTLGGLAAVPPAGVVFAKGSMIFVPFIHNASAIMLTLPGVINWMNNGTGALPSGDMRVDRFLTDKGGACNASTNDVLANTPHPIPNVNIPFSNRHWLVGAHEGAGTYNCEVVRPSAVCKMRQEYWYRGVHRGHFRFCHICRFYLVQEFNASRHGVLDRLYPGRPV